MPVCKTKICRKKTNLGNHGFCEAHGGMQDNNDLACDKSKNVITSADNAFSCDLCSNWFHISCIDGMTETVYAALNNRSECDGLKWFCMKCLSCIQNMNAPVNLVCTTGTQADTSTVCTSPTAPQTCKSIYQNPMMLRQLGHQMLKEMKTIQ